MVARLPRMDRSSMSTEQRAVADEIIAGPRGRLEGPFLAWINSPDFARHAQRLGALCRYQSGLPTRLAELAVMVTAVHWRSNTEWNIHYRIAREAGLSESILALIRAGASPDFGDPEERLVYHFTRQLQDSGRVSDRIFNQAVERFGLRIVTNLVGLIGYYTSVAMTLNVFEIEIDE